MTSSCAFIATVEAEVRSSSVSGSVCKTFVQSILESGIPPPPEILKLSMVFILAICMLLDISMCHQSVWKFYPRLCQKQSERMCLVGTDAAHMLLWSCYYPVSPLSQNPV